MIRRVSRIHYFWVALLVLVGLSAPLPYVLVEPGSPNNVLGKVKGKPMDEVQFDSLPHSVESPIPEHVEVPQGAG